MVRDLLAYSSMRDSGQNWLGEIPEYWELQRTKTLLVPRVEKGHPHEPLLAATQTKGVVRKDEYENRTVLPMKDLHLLKLVYVGDFVISLRSFQGGIEYARERGIISPAYTILYPAKRSHHGYLAKLFKSAPYVHNLALFVTGIRQGQNIDYERLSRSRLPLPPLPEQTAIVRFLDHADRRIRRYIRAKERLIALLEEQKQAIIHQVVTGQIDVRTGQPYPAYKDSGVQWLEQVPEHWKLRRMKFLVDLPSGQVDPRLKEHRHKLLIAPNHIPVGGGEVVAPETADAQSADSGKYEVRAGDVVYSKIRPNLRKAMLSPFDGLCSADMYPIRVRRRKLDPSFFLDLLLSHAVTRYAVDCSMRVAMPKINRQALGNCWLAYPTLGEQVAIVNHISAETSALGTLASLARREIEFIQEYRTRLIADVVTGKLDVSKVATALADLGPPVAAGTSDETVELGSDPDRAL